MHSPLFPIMRKLCAISAVLAAAIAVAPGASALQRQRFEATVSRVRVDVIVRDGDGDFIDDLGAADFRIFEDGREQQILGVKLVDLPGGVLVDRSRDAAVPARAASRTTTLAADPDPSAGSPNERSSDFGAMVFVVDFQGLDFRNKLRFTEAWEKLLAETEGLQVPRAVYLIDQVGRLEELAPLTQDPEILLAAAEEVGDRSNVNKSLRDQLLEDTQPGDEMLRRYRERDRAIYTYDLLTQFAEGLSARPGRTALVWVSAGVTLMYGNAYSTAGTTGRTTFAGSPNPMILQRQRAFHRAANSANVSVYTVDPTPRIEVALGMADVRRTTAPAAGGSYVDTIGDDLELDAMRNSLRLAARDTGGRAFIAWGDLTEVLREIEEDTGRYYLLTYAAPAPEGDGDYHDIRVEVRRDDVDIRARAGYFDYAAHDRRDRFVSAALSLPGTVADLPLRAQVTRTWTPEGTANVLLTVAIDAGEVGLRIDADGTFAELEIHAAVLDEWLELKGEHHGTVQRRLRPVVPPGTIALPIMPSLPRLRSGEFLIHRAELVLEPDEYDVRVMALDTTTGRVGSTRISLVIPDDPPTAWRTSDLLLVESDGRNNRNPVVDGRIPAYRLVSAFLEVYNAVTPVVSGAIRAVDSPSSAFGDGAEIFRTPLYSDADGIHRGALLLPPLAAGTYLLELDVEDAGAGQNESFSVDLEVVSAPGRARRD